MRGLLREVKYYSDFNNIQMANHMGINSKTLENYLNGSNGVKMRLFLTNLKKAGCDLSLELTGEKTDACYLLSPTIVPKILRSCVRKSQWCNVEIAAMLGRTPEQVGRWNNGRSDITADIFFKILEICGYKCKLFLKVREE
jgi:plasmid maintenance system antidote protein VapI